jgi:hypothetical protein
MGVYEEGFCVSRGFWPQNMECVADPGSGYERGTIGYTSIFTPGTEANTSSLNISCSHWNLAGLYITSAWLATEEVRII